MGSGQLLSWYTARDLGFLPPTYPSQMSSVGVRTSTVATSGAPQPVKHQITKEDLIREYPQVFSDVPRPMPGEQFHIGLEDDVVPYCVTTPRTIPYAYRDKEKAELDRMVSERIIAPVTEPTRWCAPIVVAPKKETDNIRLCVDFTKLNKYVRRERYQSPTPMSGYHQCPLDEESRPLTTVITPFGRFQFLRAPFGAVRDLFYLQTLQSANG